MKRIILLLLAVVMLVLLYQFTTDNEIAIEAVDYGLLRNGTFQGEYSTLLVSALVEISIEESTITDIQIIEHDCGKGKPAEKIVDVMIENNTHHVDTVSGATMSSNVIMKAVETALKHSIEGR